MAERALQPMLPNPARHEGGTRRTLKVAAAREELERGLEELGQAVARLEMAKEGLYRTRAQFEALWGLTQPDDCPEFELEARVSRSA